MHVRLSGAPRSRRAIALLCVLAGLFIRAAVAQSAELTDREILTRADESRGNLSGVTWDVKIVSNDRGENREQDFFVQARGFDFLAEVTAPPRRAGSKILLVNKNMWFTTPGVSKPVPISARQKLQGLAAYGDIPATNYADDFLSERQPPETVEGELCHVFLLTCRHKKGSTYDKIRCWVSAKRLVTTKSEFFTVSGKLIKSAAMKYDNRVIVRGTPRPFISSIDFWDALQPKLRTRMIFNAPSIKPVPAYVFNLNLMTQ